uniref:Uncharacterized protein n=1 Tax=Hyaloperonospora arabidopsidis (strain Emoy2) TaxID=559515 RepID=M4BW62_HYAAE
MGCTEIGDGVVLEVVLVSVDGVFSVTWSVISIDGSISLEGAREARGGGMGTEGVSWLELWGEDGGGCSETDARRLLTRSSVVKASSSFLMVRALEAAGKNRESIACAIRCVLVLKRPYQST